MDESRMTLCPECKHYLSIEDGPRTGVWYNLWCRAFTKEPAIDPTTGKQKYRDSNGYLSDDKYYHCRDFNDGHCQYFEQKLSSSLKPKNIILKTKETLSNIIEFPSCFQEKSDEE